MHKRRGRSRCIGMLLAASVLWGGLYAEEKKSSSSEGIRSPKDPAAPSVEVRDRKGSEKESDVPATIVTARGDSRTGALLLKFGSIEVQAVEEGALMRKSVAFADIESIEFTRWRGTERRKNEFAFHPSEMKITLRDRKFLQCRGNIPALNRLVFKDSRGSRSIYSYFYDYWKDGVWKNSGQAAKEYPETSPFGDTLVKIHFIREEMKNPLEKLLSR